MKKLLAILFFAGHNVCHAQIKIGSIALDDNTAKMYLSDCYAHPDTVMPEQEFGCTSSGCEDQNRQIRARRLELEKTAIGQVYDTVRFAAYSDTAYDGLAWFCDFRLDNNQNADSWKRYKKIAKKISVRRHEAGFDIEWKGFLVPRKPSEQDFVKWYIKYLTTK